MRVALSVAVVLSAMALAARRSRRLREEAELWATATEAMASSS